MDQEMVAKMGLALERACRFLPNDGGNVRKFVAERVVHCAKNHTQTLAGLTEAARQAVADFNAIQVAGRRSLAPYTGPEGGIEVSVAKVSQDRLREIQDCYAILAELAH